MSIRATLSYFTHNGEIKLHTQSIQNLSILKYVFKVKTSSKSPIVQSVPTFKERSKYILNIQYHKETQEISHKNSIKRQIFPCQLQKIA